MKLNRSISSVALLFSALGSIVGSGWLFGPLYAAQVAGPAAILSWVIGGALMIVIALTFAELATTFPEAGGMIKFAEYSHGPLMSFTVGWMVWLSSVVVAPVETLAILQYMATYIPHLIKPGSTLLTGFGMMAAAILMMFMCILNFYGAKFFSRISTILVAFKLIVPFLTIIVLFIVDFHTSNLTTAGFMPTGWHGVFAALPLGGVIFSFIGYSTAIQLAGEARNPKRAIPLAVMGSLIFCILLYGLLQLVFIGSVNPAALAAGWTHLNFAGDSGPFAGILMGLGIFWLVLIIYTDAVVSPFGTGFIYTAATARVSYAMCETGFFPKLLHKLNRFGVPRRAIFLNYVIGLFLFLPFPGWQSMVSFIISCFVISYIIGPVALMILRRTKPEVTRHFRLPFAGGFSLVAFYICNLLVFWTGWQTVSKLLVALAIGFLVFCYRYWQGAFKGDSSIWKCALWLFPYLIGMGFISYFGSFGHGTGGIPFGIDFLVIAGFSLVAYYLAMKTSEMKLAENKLPSL